METKRRNTNTSSGANIDLCERLWALQEDLEAAYEAQGDMEAEFGSEVALFGDGWAGGEVDLRERRRGLAQMEAECRFLKAALGLEVV